MDYSNVSLPNNSLPGVHPGWNNGMSTETVAIASIFVSTIAIIGSLLCLESLRNDRKQRKSTKLLFGNLAVCTIVSSSGFLVHGYTGLVRDTVYSRHPHSSLCQLTAFVCLGVMAASKTCHLAIAFHRVFSVVLHDIMFLRGKAVCAVLLFYPWVFNMLLYSFPFFGLFAPYRYSVLAQRCAPSASNPIDRIIVPMVELCLVGSCYLAVWYKVYSSKRRISSRQIRQVLTVIHESRSTKIERVVTKYSFWACGFLLVCQMTSIVPGLLVMDGKEMLAPTGQTLNLIHLAGVATCPWFIAAMNGGLKQSVQKFGRLVLPPRITRKTRISVNMVLSS